MGRSLAASNHHRLYLHRGYFNDRDGAGCKHANGNSKASGSGGTLRATRDLYEGKTAPSAVFEECAVQDLGAAQFIAGLPDHLLVLASSLDKVQALALDKHTSRRDFQPHMRKAHIGKGCIDTNGSEFHVEAGPG